MDPAYGNHLQRGWTSSRRCKLLWPGQKAWVQAGGLGSLGVLGAGLVSRPTWATPASLRMNLSES